MDFKTVLSLIIKKFEEGKVHYALIGGFAMGALGVPRSTVDIDFLVHYDDLPKIDRVMKNNGYECVYKSENVSQYVSSLKIFGEVDFIHAFRDISKGMLKRAIEKEVFEGKFKIKVLRPEDIIGLKVQAMANDETKTNREYLDIESLMAYYKNNLDWPLLEEYFSLFELNKKFEELKKKYKC